MLKQIFCIWVKFEQPADFLSLTSTLLMGRCCCNNLTVSASLMVSLPYAWLRLCQDPATWAQLEALAHTNTPTVTKKSYVAVLTFNGLIHVSINLARSHNFDLP